MTKLTACLVALQMVALTLGEADKKSPEPATVLKEISSPNEDVDAIEGLGWCREDEDLTLICITCAQLPGEFAVAPEDCCNNPNALEECKNCIENPDECVMEENELTEGGDEADDQSSRLSKRYGMLLFGGKGLYNLPPRSDKRYGLLNNGKRSDDDEKRWGTLSLGKRFGTLNLGSYFAKRYGMLNLGHLGRGYGSFSVGKRYGAFDNKDGEYDDPDKKWGTLNMDKKSDIVPEEKRYGTLSIGKRFGTLNLGKRYGSLGFSKRFGTLNLGKRYGSLGLGNKRFGTLNLGKRFGTLHLGKRFGTLNVGGGYDSVPLGKRYGSLNLGKRFGTLNMGSTYGYYPYKRSEYVPYDGNIGIDMKKRYGRLFMGPIAGKRSLHDSENEIKSR